MTRSSEAIDRMNDACRISSWEEVVRICEEQLSATEDRLFWTLQLGFANFLWEGNVDAHDIASPKIMKALAIEYPAAPDILFWTAYIVYITSTPDDFVLGLLDRSLKLDPNHSYANLVTAGYLDSLHSVASSRRALKLLERARIKQPGNRRVLRHIIQLAVRLGEREQAVDAAHTVLTTAPFIESSLGCMNTYANDVLTLATSPRGLDELARRTIETSGRS